MFRSASTGPCRSRGGALFQFQWRPRRAGRSARRDRQLARRRLASMIFGSALEVERTQLPCTGSSASNVSPTASSFPCRRSDGFSAPVRRRQLPTSPGYVLGRPAHDPSGRSLAARARSRALTFSRTTSAELATATRLVDDSPGGRCAASAGGAGPASSRTRLSPPLRRRGIPESNAAIVAGADLSKSTLSRRYKTSQRRAARQGAHVRSAGSDRDSSSERRRRGGCRSCTLGGSASSSDGHEVDVRLASRRRPLRRAEPARRPSRPVHRRPRRASRLASWMLGQMPCRGSARSDRGIEARRPPPCWRRRTCANARCQVQASIAE